MSPRDALAGACNESSLGELVALRFAVDHLQRLIAAHGKSVSLFELDGAVSHALEERAKEYSTVIGMESAA